MEDKILPFENKSLTIIDDVYPKDKDTHKFKDICRGRHFNFIPLTYEPREQNNLSLIKWLCTKVLSEDELKVNKDAINRLKEILEK